MNTNYAKSQKEKLSALPLEQKLAWLESLSEEAAGKLVYDWEFNARPKQYEGFAQKGWLIWLILAGRGFGKTRTGAEWVRYQVEVMGKRRIGIIAPTSADLRGVIVEGESGLLNICPPENRPIYEPTKRQLTWPNGAIATLYSAEEPDRLRGPNHDALWLDEIAGWSGNIQLTWDMAMFGLRLGEDPQICITTTPKPIPLIQKFIEWAKDPVRRMLVTTGSSYENRSNLAKSFFNQIVQYEGTTLGRQEIHAEVINLEEQGIIKRSWFKLWKNGRPLPHFLYIIQSYDTAFTEKTHNDPTACTTWGVFEDVPENSPEGTKGVFCAMLLDSWRDHMQYPELRVRVVEEYESKFGGIEGDMNRPGHSPDIVLIEEKGSGISLIQDLSRTNVPIRSYNPGRADKTQRLHAVSHLIMNGRVYIPESGKVPGEPRTWATDFITEICVYPNSLHDDYVDTCTQALCLLRDQSWLSIDPEEKDEDYADERKKKKVSNPYAQ